MAAPSYKARAIVLRKTKLGEKDLIITMLTEQGEKLQAIAKGARKPGGSHAAKLDIFSEVEGLFVKGKGLDIITDSKLLSIGSSPTASLELTAVANPIAELLSYIAQEDLAQPRLFDLSVATFKRLWSAEDNALLTYCAAALWKILAQAGYLPSFSDCVLCGDTITLPYESNLTKLDSEGEQLLDASHLTSQKLTFSYGDGGVVCHSCASSSETVLFDATVLSWCNYLIMERFNEIEQHLLNASTAFSLIDLARNWTRYHIDKDIRSIDFLFNSGLFTSEQG